MAEVSNPVKPSFGIPKKKIPNDKNDELMLEDDQMVREDDRQVVEDKTENVGLHVDGKKSRKRKVGSASGTSTYLRSGAQTSPPVSCNMGHAEQLLFSCLSSKFAVYR